MSYRCRVCSGVVPSRDFLVREMMHGTREEFKYIECGGCSSIQIETIPPDEVLSRHYPDDYYSMQPTGTGGMRGRLKNWVAAERDKHLLGLPNTLGSIVASWKRSHGSIYALAAVGVDKHSRVLDVGCGKAANFLRRLEELGFDGLAGLDPYLPDSFRLDGGTPVTKGDMSSLGQDKFDVIILNHAFEHVPDPEKDMALLATKLQPKGKLIIRVPTPSSYAFEYYGVNWVQFDAPRHLHLYSRKGLALLASRFGLVVEKVLDDSEALQFVGSEMYRMDVPLRSKKRRSIFNKSQLSAFRKRADELNKCGRGDQAAFILAPA